MTEKGKNVGVCESFFFDAERANSLLDLMDLLQKTDCINKKISILRGALTTLHKINYELLHSSMQTTIITPLFREIVDLAIPDEFADRGHFIFDRDDFANLVERTEIALRFLYEFFKLCCDCSLTETKPVDECLPFLVVVISTNIRNSLWSKDTVHNLVLQVLNQIRMLYKVESLSELLLLYQKSKDLNLRTPASSLLGHYLNIIKCRLSRNNWQANPTFVESFFWTLTQMMKFPYLGDYLDLVLPPSLILIDSHLTENKVMGILCLQHISSNVSKDELRWHGRADVVYTALKQQIYSREPDIIRVLQPALLIVLQIIDKDPEKSATVMRPKQIDTIFSIIIANAATENGIDLRRLYAKCIPDFVNTLGICVVRHLSRLVSLVSDYLEVFDGPEEEARFHTLNTLKAMLQNAWPRIPNHANALLKSILKLVQDIVCDQSTTPVNVKDKLKEEAVSCLSLLIEICPDIDVCLEAVFKSEELSQIAETIQRLRSNI